MADVDLQTLREKLSEARRRVEALGPTAVDAAASDQPAASRVEKGAMTLALAGVHTAYEELRSAHAALDRRNTELAQAREAVKAQKRRYGELFELVTDGCLVTDARGIIGEANAAAATLLHSDGRSLAGRSLADFVVRAERARFRRELQRLGEASRRITWPLLLGPGRPEPTPAQATVLGVREGGRRELRWVIHDMSERRRLEAEVIAASSAERDRLGRDLHDGLNTLAAAVMMVRSLKHKLEVGGAPPEQRRAAEEIDQVVQNAIDEARQLSHAMTSDRVAADDLAEALRHLLRTLERFPDTRTSLHCTEPCSLPPTLVEHLYRITQEAAHNAVQHGHASELRIEVTRRPAELELKIIDNGGGFSADAAAGDLGGVGLRLMRHRAALIHAVLDIRPLGEGGTQVRCAAPLAGG